MNQQITAIEPTVQLEMFGMGHHVNIEVPKIHTSDPPAQIDKPPPIIEIIYSKTPVLRARGLDGYIDHDVFQIIEPRSTNSEVDILDDDSDEENPINLEETDGDTSDTKISKRMIRRMLDDLNEQYVSDFTTDMYGISFPEERTDKQDKEVFKLDALIWLYALNPDGSAITFEWACDEIGLNPSIIRNVIARSMRAELKIVLKFLAQLIDHKYAIACECELAEYVNLTGWNLN